MSQNMNGVLAVIVAIAIFGGITYLDLSEKQNSIGVAEIAGLSSANISPAGELAEIFKMNSSYTDVQRSNKVEEISGKIVQWTLPVYEVSKHDDNVYRVQTSGGSTSNFGGTNYVGTFLNLNARGTTQASYIESLRTGDMLTFKGRITGTFLRNIEIEPAIVIMR